MRDELNRILMSANFVDGMQNLLEAGLLFLIIPELCEGWLLSQFHPFHQHTVLDHTLEALRYTPSSLEVRLAILLHDVGKPRSFSRGADGRGHFYGHELLGSEMAEQILQTMHYSSRIIKKVTFLIREHMLNLHMGPAAMRRLIARIGREAVPDLISVAQADFMAHSPQLLVRLADSWESFRSRLSFVLSEDTAFHLHDLAINGTDLLQELGCRPGPLVGRILKALWGEVLNEPLKNKRSYLLKRAREIAAELSRT